jgi:hypothetical protein
LSSTELIKVSMSSTTHTAIGPSYSSGRSGDKRGRDGDDGRDRRPPDKPKPTDKIGAADFGPEGRIRRLLILLLQTANLGTLPSGSLLTRGGAPKTIGERTTAVRSWVDGLLWAPDRVKKARFTELAEAFVHTLRAVDSAGFYDQLIAMLVDLFTTRAEERD